MCLAGSIRYPHAASVGLVSRAVVPTSVVAEVREGDAKGVVRLPPIGVSAVVDMGVGGVVVTIG